MEILAPRYYKDRKGGLMQDQKCLERGHQLDGRGDCEECDTELRLEIEAQIRRQENEVE